MCGQAQNKGANRSRSLSQISILVAQGRNGSVLEERAVLGCRCTASHSEALSPSRLLLLMCEADQSEHLCPTLCLLTKSKMAAITGTQWRGKIRVPKVFNSSIWAKTYSDVSPHPHPPPAPPRIFLSPRDGSVIPGFLLTICPYYPSLSFIPSFLFPWPSMPLLKTWPAFPYVGVASFSLKQ